METPNQTEGTAQEANFAGQVIGAQEVQTIDISKYIGKKVKIGDFVEMEGNYGPFVKLQTEDVDTINTGNGEVTLRASKIFSLRRNEDGKIYWAKGKELDQFLAKHNVESYTDLVGISVQLVPQKSKRGDGREFLSFN